MGFGDSGHPVPTDVVSPEHAAARVDGLRGGGPGGGPGGDPQPRPGCIWTIVGVFVAIAVIVVLIWLIGRVLG